MTQQNDNGAAAPSPLAEATPTSLDEFFSRDPFGYGDLDKERLVAEFRRMRVVWEKAEAAGLTNKSKARNTAASKTTLGDLGLDD